MLRLCVRHWGTWHVSSLLHWGKLSVSVMELDFQSLYRRTNENEFQLAAKGKGNPSRCQIQWKREKGWSFPWRTSLKLQVKLGQVRNSLSYLTLDVGFWPDEEFNTDYTIFVILKNSVTEKHPEIFRFAASTTKHKILAAQLLAALSLALLQGDCSSSSLKGWCCCRLPAKPLYWLLAGPFRGQPADVPTILSASGLLVTYLLVSKTLCHQQDLGLKQPKGTFWKKGAFFFTRAPNTFFPLLLFLYA